MMRRTKIILAVFGLAAATLVQAAAYDLTALEQLALADSRAVLAARDQVAAARYAVESARAFPNPELEYLSGDTRPRGAAGAVGNARSMTLTQPLDLPWQRQPRIAAAEAALEASAAGGRGFEADLRARLRLRYFELLRRDAELKNAREDAALMESLRGKIALRVELGEAPRFELIKADAETLNAQKVAQAASFRLEQARSQLRQVVGAGLPADFSVSGSLRDVPELPSREAVRQRLSASPDLVRGRAEVVRAERQLELERARRLPGVALKAGLDEDPEMRNAKLGLVVSIPLWDRRSGPVGEAAAELSRSRNELAVQEFSLEQQLAVAFQQYDIALAQVTALESGILRQAESARNVAEAAYRFGERGFIEVIDAQRVYRAARFELITARYELAAAWVEVERLQALPAGSKE